VVRRYTLRWSSGGILVSADSVQSETDGMAVLVVHLENGSISSYIACPFILSLDRERAVAAFEQCRFVISA
jgi:hypothetical protein